MSTLNLECMLAKADRVDTAEGLLAYERYHEVMVRLADKYQVHLFGVVAAFCALSPNNDYLGNLRSLVSLLEGMRAGLLVSEITTSSYNHCRDRAYGYLLGYDDFRGKAKGQKIINFFHNVYDPTDGRWVTIDGHMVAIWRGQNLTMKEAIIRKRSEYIEIANAVKRLAFHHFMLPCQLQAILWFTRKRTAKVRYVEQGDLFRFADNDQWATLKHDIKPYDFRKVTDDDDRDVRTWPVPGNDQDQRGDLASAGGAQGSLLLNDG